MESGSDSKRLQETSKNFKLTKLPIESGSEVKLLYDKFKIVRVVKYPISDGIETRVSRYNLIPSTPLNSNSKSN